MSYESSTLKKRKIFFKVSTLLGLKYEELGCEDKFEILAKERKTFQHFPPPVVLNTHGGIRGELGREVGDRK